MIVRDLTRGPRRFKDLEAAGINPRTLSARLRHLQTHGFIVLTRTDNHPPTSHYRLTEKGEALLPLIKFLRDYGETWLPGPESLAAEARA